jgi:hypothetical protein
VVKPVEHGCCSYYDPPHRGRSLALLELGQRIPRANIVPAPAEPSTADDALLKVIAGVVARPICLAPICFNALRISPQCHGRYCLPA